ncbi:hypothetical protein ROE7235_01269 [Roseibaca ekhonensis]|uniref:Uncharacterized protein n=1 Tax=Roseinatronobacter ekhonensis TaxID=254356 RepID=A0A3B0M761_9RHOB|nr:hypothetical protein ROE7235_01269 [Roseibaca ekhonensis]
MDGSSRRVQPLSRDIADGPQGHDRTARAAGC